MKKLIESQNGKASAVIEYYARIADEKQQPDESYEVDHYWKVQSVELYSNDHQNVIKLKPEDFAVILLEIQTLHKTRFKDVADPR